MGAPPCHAGGSAIGLSATNAWDRAAAGDVLDYSRLRRLANHWTPHVLAHADTLAGSQALAARVY